MKAGPPDDGSRLVSFRHVPPHVVMFDRFGCICLIIHHGIKLLISKSPPLKPNVQSPLEMKPNFKKNEN